MTKIPIPHTPLNKRAPEEQPREKLARYGPEHLSTAELLAILIRLGTRGKSAVDVANAFLNDHCLNLKYVSKMSVEEICQSDGLGPANAGAVAAAFELGRRATHAKTEKAIFLKTLEDVADLFRSKYGVAEPEKFVAFYITRNHRLIDHREVARGRGNTVVVDPQAVFRPALLCQAKAVILAHNHPSGKLEASEKDIALTKQLAGVGTSICIPVAEHAIVCAEGVSSVIDSVTIHF